MFKIPLPDGLALWQVSTDQFLHLGKRVFSNHRADRFPNGDFVLKKLDDLLNIFLRDGLFAAQYGLNGY